MSLAAEDVPVQRGRSRLSDRVLGGGLEPDPRFTLANERTFLAWIRTALAFLAAGIAVEAFTAEIFPPPVRTLLALLLLGLAGLTSALAALRWIGVERRLRRGEPLSLPVLAPVLGGGGVLACGLLIGFLLGR